MLGTGYFLKINSQQEKPMYPSVVNADIHDITVLSKNRVYFNPHSTIARSHTTRNRDFLESISFSF